MQGLGQESADPGHSSRNSQGICSDNLFGEVGRCLNHHHDDAQCLCMMNTLHTDYREELEYLEAQPAQKLALELRAEAKQQKRRPQQPGPSTTRRRLTLDLPELPRVLPEPPSTLLRIPAADPERLQRPLVARVPVVPTDESDEPSSTSSTATLAPLTYLDLLTHPEPYRHLSSIHDGPLNPSRNASSELPTPRITTTTALASRGLGLWPAQVQAEQLQEREQPTPSRSVPQASGQWLSLQSPLPNIVLRPRACYPPGIHSSRVARGMLLLSALSDCGCHSMRLFAGGWQH